MNKINFSDETQVSQIISEFEIDVENQMGRSCTIEFSMDKDNKNVFFSFSLEGLTYSLDVNYSGFNGSIRPINFQFDD